MRNSFLFFDHLVTLAYQGRSSKAAGRAKRAACAQLASVASVLLPTAAGAIVTRHDVPVEAYVRKAADLPSYCRMMAPDGGGALIAPSWVITAAHLTPEFKPGHRFRCGDEVLRMAEVVVHPAYKEKVGRHDLALIRLQEPSKHLPLRLWRGDGEDQRVVSLIGHWQGGNGTTGVLADAEKKLLGATNRVADADEHWLKFVMNAPSDSATTPLEGVSGGGDSGAPAYLRSGGHTYLLGVGSRNSDTNDDGIEQNYGDTDLYVRVSSHVPWIDQVLEGRETTLTRLMMRHESLLTWLFALFVIVGLALLLRRSLAGR